MIGDKAAKKRRKRNSGRKKLGAALPRYTEGYLQPPLPSIIISSSNHICLVRHVWWFDLFIGTPAAIET